MDYRDMLRDPLHFFVHTSLTRPWVTLAIQSAIPVRYRENGL